jgi:hypothetical protein
MIGENIVDLVDDSKARAGALDKPPTRMDAAFVACRREAMSGSPAARAGRTPQTSVASRARSDGAR